VSGELPWRTDSQRWRVEIEAQRKYTAGVHGDDLLEAVHRMVVDLLDAGHIPSRDMLRMISGELKTAWWPDRKQHQRSKEAAFLNYVQQVIKYRAAKAYGNAPGARTKAEQDIAEMHGLSVSGLRKKRARFSKRVKEREAALERQRKRPLRK
jgi:hypothetical protein